MDLSGTMKVVFGILGVVVLMTVIVQLYPVIASTGTSIAALNFTLSNLFSGDNSIIGIIVGVVLLLAVVGALLGKKYLKH